MRLWHKDLLRVLPQKQICSQWRECCLIAKEIAENGTPNHILVNKIMDYDIKDFITYTTLVRIEMERRHYKCNGDNFIKYFEPKINFTIWGKNIFEGWHNDIYLRECLYNLEEKAMCGGIPADDWKVIYERYKDKFELWSGN